MTPRLADASDMPVLPLWVLVTIAALFVVGLLAYSALRDPAPVTLPDVEPEPLRCNALRPHAMIPTADGWECAHDCGERWYVDEKDELAVADLALWSIENGWVIEA